MKTNEKVNKIQKKTLKDVTKKLNLYHKCLLVRPTGFGKTKLATDILKKYKKAVYLYPFNTIRNIVEEYNITETKLELHNYAMMRRIFKNKDQFFNKFRKYNTKNSIFIFDEAHFIGATNTSKFIIYLMKTVCPDANFLGITATPNRTDKVDIKWHYFDGITSYEYNIEDAINDGIFLKPYYVYTPLDFTKLEKHYYECIDNLDIGESKKIQLKNKVKKSINPEKLNISNLPDIIYRNLDKFSNSMNYYKFILYFTTFENLHMKLEEIKHVFQTVFPECKLNTIIVSSESERYHLNLDKIK